MWPALVLSVALAAPSASSLPASPSAARDDVPNQTLVFFNARIALREGRAEDALKLWLIRNSLRNRGEPGLHDDDFRSVVWAALGKLGLCQDGLREDEGGAGLWPVALHNWTLIAMARGPAVTEPPPWDAFSVARQQRFISLHDVVSAEELRSAVFFRTSCLRPYSTGGRLSLDLGDRLTVALFLKELLQSARESLVVSKLESAAVIDVRLFDLELVISELQARRARQQGREQAQRARSVGVSVAGAAELREEASRFPEDSPQAAFLRRSLTWRPDEWLALNPQRRLFLFAQAKPLSRDDEVLLKLVVGLVDRHTDARNGEELEAWLGHLGGDEHPERRDLVIRGDRGARLLELEPAPSGFRERSVIALHRGVAFMEAGQLLDALRSFAFALRHAEESRAQTEVAGLSRRWLSYALSRFETDDEVIALLKALVPRNEYNAVVEDLVWRAAFRADARSFERLAATVRPGTSFDARLARLRPLAQGRSGQVVTQLRKELGEEPYAVLRFVRTLVERVEVEDPEVRAAQVPTLEALATMLRPVAEATVGANTAHARVAGELLGRVMAILDGLARLEDDGPGRLHGLKPQTDTFAGSIRLAPSDALPWPFRAPSPSSPTVFAPLNLLPVEWRGEDGARVHGWRITE